jgi:hypothetical protein
VPGHAFADEFRQPKHTGPGAIPICVNQIKRRPTLDPFPQWQLCGFKWVAWSNRVLKNKF